MNTDPKQDEREKLLGSVAFLEAVASVVENYSKSPRSDVVETFKESPWKMEELAEYILANYIPRSEATAAQERAVAEAYSQALKHDEDINSDNFLDGGRQQRRGWLRGQVDKHTLNAISLASAPQNRGEG